MRPLRTNPRRLPQDLRVRYDVHGPRSDQALARHLDEVIGYWSERSREQPDYSRAVYVALLKAHQQLVTDPTVRLHSATWWSAYQPPEPDAAAEPSSQPLSDADTYTAQHCSPQRLEQPSVDVTAEADAAIEPLDGAVAAATTGVTGPASTVNALITDLPTAEGQMIDGAVADRVHGLTASRIGDDIELSWVWPSWATTAIVSWDDGIHKLVDREEFRRTGRWRTTLSPALSDGRVEFSVAVRGADPNRREWSKVARVVAPEPC